MGQKTYNKTVNELRLADELGDAYPALMGPQLPDGSRGGMAYDIRANPNRVVVRWDDATGVTGAQIDAVVLAHDASKKSRSQEREEASKMAQSVIKNANPNQSAKLEDVQRLAQALGVDWIW